MTDAPDTKKPFRWDAVVGVVVAAAVVGGILGYLAGTSAGPATGGRALPAPPASPDPPVQLTLGEEGVTAAGARVTALSWDRGAPGWPTAPEGTAYSSAVVRFCNDPGTYKDLRIRQIPYLFNLVDTQGALIDPYVDVGYISEELASYNVGVISADQCVTGKVVFKNAIGQDVRSIRFTGNGRFEWDVSGIANGTSPAPSPSWTLGPSSAEGSG